MLTSIPAKCGRLTPECLPARTSIRSSGAQRCRVDLVPGDLAEDPSGCGLVEYDEALLLVTASSRSPATINIFPSREKLTNEQRVQKAIPLNRLTIGAISLCQTSLPLAASQTRTNPSKWPVAIRSPAGDHAAETTSPTGSRCHHSANAAPSRARKSRSCYESTWRRPTHQARTPDAIATSPGIVIVRSVVPVSASRMQSRQKSATATCRPSFERAA